jgi:hypothetical protein
MRTYDPNKPLFSLHVPKTAGTSFRLTLERWFPDERLKLHYRDHKTLALPILHEADAPICIHGHFDATHNCGVDDYYPEAQQFVAFLRDPLDRVASLYFYTRWHHERTAKSTVFQRVTRSRTISGFMSFEEWIPFLADEKAAGRATSYPWFLPGAPDVNTIIRNMAERFVFVGLTETYDASLLALAERLGKTASRPRFVNRTRRNRQNDIDCQRALHMRLFPEEYELYAFAAALNASLLSDASIRTQSGIARYCAPSFRSTAL